MQNVAILVVVVPCGNIFYASRVSELETKKRYNLTIDFGKFGDLFTRVKDASQFRIEALKIMQK